MKATLATIALITGLSFSSSFAADTKNPSITLPALKGTPYEPSITLTVPNDTPHASVTKIRDACIAAGLTPVALRTWVPALMAAGTKTPGITLTVPKDTPYASVTKVLDTCKAAGLNAVSIETTRGDSQ